MPVEYREDGGGAPLTAREFERISAVVRERPRSPLKSEQLISASTELTPTDETITYELVNAYGIAQFTDEGVTEVPLVAVSSETVTTTLHHITLGYDYSNQEARRSRATNRFDTIARKQQACERGHHVTHDLASWQGYPKKRIFGMATHPNCPLAASSINLLTATGQQIVDYFTDLGVVYTQLNRDGTQADTVAMPSDVLRRLTSLEKTANSDSGRTVMAQLRIAFPEISRWESVEALDSVPELGSMMVIYNRSPMYVERLPGMMPEVDPTPQKKGTMNQVVMESRHGGVRVHYPTTVLRVIGIKG